MPHSLRAKLSGLHYKGILEDKDYKRLCHALDLEKAEQEPCDDAISREELLKAIDTWDKFGCDADTKLVRYQDHYVPYIHYDDIIKCIKGMPSVTQKSGKSGKWIKIPKYGKWKCSMCGTKFRFTFKEHDYCPNCGAKMVEPQEISDRNLKMWHDIYEEEKRRTEGSEDAT